MQIVSNAPVGKGETLSEKGQFLRILVSIVAINHLDVSLFFSLFSREAIPIFYNKYNMLCYS